MNPLLVLVIVILLLIAAGWWFDRSRRREGRSPYVDRRPPRPMVGVDVGGEMVPPPPSRPHPQALDRRSERDAADDADEADPRGRSEPRR